MAMGWGLAGLVIFAAAAQGAQTPASAPRGHRPPGSDGGSFNLQVPEHPFDLVLARPGKNAITLSLLAYQSMEAFLTLGTPEAPIRTPQQTFPRGVPVAILVEGLQPDTAYPYQLHLRPAGSEEFHVAESGTFQTARSAGSSFSFTLSADVHLDEHTTPEMYLRTLENIRAERPDFHLDLGNLFMTDKHVAREEALRQYLAQRYYLSRMEVPVLLTLGTHDGEAGKYDDATPENLAVWSNRTRKAFFPNPFPDGFYTGNTTAAPSGGYLENYYAWQWGDVLMVVLDAFRYSTRPRGGGGDGWGWSLGQTQYRWLKQTLETSRARYKCVFIHNLLCRDQATRGGVEIAGFNEWGGLNPDGTAGFQEHRPGWELPVHALLVRNHVSAVFKAHDNFYARQQLDGLVYLMVPQPSFAGNDRIRDLANYGYKQGVFLGNSGHVRVRVTPTELISEYVGAAVSGTSNRTNGQVLDRCAIAPH